MEGRCLLIVKQLRNKELAYPSRLSFLHWIG